MAKIIVDTSVWIEFFRNKLSKSYADLLSKVLAQDLVVITDIIRHELLVGAKDRGEYQRLAGLLSPLPVLRVQDSQLEDLILFGFKLRTLGLLAKYTDLTIAFLGHFNRFPLFTFDGYFKRLKQKGLIQLVEL